eukprot:359285-Chlamydomonas_euryale.AAC.2
MRRRRIGCTRRAKGPQPPHPAPHQSRPTCRAACAARMPYHWAPRRGRCSAPSSTRSRLRLATQRARLREGVGVRAPLRRNRHCHCRRRHR